MLRAFMEIESSRPSPWRSLALATSGLAWIFAMSVVGGSPSTAAPPPPQRTRCDLARGDHDAVADYGARGPSNCAECHATTGVACGSSRFGMTSTKRSTPATRVTSATLKIGHGLPGQ
jgi:hypothetical protein